MTSEPRKRPVVVKPKRRTAVVKMTPIGSIESGDSRLSIHVADLADGSAVVLARTDSRGSPRRTVRLGARRTRALIEALEAALVVAYGEQDHRAGRTGAHVEKNNE